MIKRLMKCMMTAALLLSLAGTALADGAVPNLRGGTEQETADGFSFRGGVRWGMSQAEIQQLEQTDMVERSQDGWSVLYTTSQVEVSRFQADLVYMFFQNQLRMITYDFGQDGNAASYTYLRGALSSVYGETREPGAEEVVRLMDQIYPGYYTVSLLNQVCGWTAPDGTTVYLYYYGEGTYAILYAGPDNSSAGAGGYQTNGL